MYQYKSYLKKKLQTFRRTTNPTNKPNNIASNQVSNLDASILLIRHELTRKERNEHKTE